MLESNHKGPPLPWLNAKPKTVGNREPTELIKQVVAWAVIQNAMNSGYRVNTVRQEAGQEEGNPTTSFCCSLDERWWMVWIRESRKDGDGIQDVEIIRFGGQMNKRLGESDWGEPCHTLRKVPGLIFVSVWGEGCICTRAWRPEVNLRWQSSDAIHLLFRNRLSKK